MDETERQSRDTVRRGLRRSRRKALVGALVVLIVTAVAGVAWPLEIAPLHVAGLAVVALLLAAAAHRLLRQPDLLREQVRARTVALECALTEARQGKHRLAAVTEHLEGVLQSSPDAVVAGDGEGIVTEWNAAAERIYGWPREEMVGRHIRALVPPGEPTAVEQAATEEDASGAVRTVVPRLRRDGTVFQAELTLSVFRDEGGRVRTWVSIVRDVTHELVVSRARDAVRSVLQPTAAVRALVEVLEEACPAEVTSLVELSGSTAKRHACISRSGEVLAPPEHLAVTESIVARAADADGPVLEEGFRPDRAIGHAWVSWRVAIPLRRSDDVVAVLVLGGDGDPPTGRALELLGRVGAAIAQDAVNVLLYERQREATERLYEVDQLKSDFLSAVSHELRTPLTAISGFASTLEDRWDDLDAEMRRNFVHRIVGRSKALDDLVRELLDYSRLESRPVEVEPVPCELAREIRREVHDLEHILDGHRLEVETPDDLLVEADPAALSRILQNLLTNAAKFSPPDSRIRIEAARSNGHVVLRVSDEGIGIPPEEHERIFQRFYRVSRGDRVQAGGTGIGLALVKEYVETLGGRVWVESEPGLGSTFVVTLRRVDAAVHPADDRREQALG